MKNNITKNVYIFIGILLTGLTYGQVINGSVSDKTGKLPGVSIIVKGTINAAQTDLDGNYKIKDINSKSILVFSYVGYKTKEEEVGNKTEINVVLEEALNTLSEVVVVGYGSVKKSDATGAIDVVKASELNKGVVSSVDMLLNGQVAGVQVTSGSGQPGANNNVKIRGVNSISASSEPLYVIDGVPVDNGRASSSFGADSGLNSIAMNPLTMIAASDIESITVLKDASATAIYGSRGANGVILIKTKSGKSGVMSINFSTSVGVSTLSKKIDLLDANDYKKYVPVTNPARANVNTDWQNEIFRTAVSYNNNLSFSNGNETSAYRVSIGNTKQEGIVEGTDLNRSSARLNVNHKMFDERLILNANFSDTHYKMNNFLESQSGGANGGLINNALKGDPTQPVYNADGTFNEYSDTSFRNPVAMFKQISDVSEGDRLIMNTDAEYFFIPKTLSLKTNLSYDVDNSSRNVYQPLDSKISAQYGGRAIVQNSSYSNLLVETYLQYNKIFNEKHAVNLVGGYSWQEFDNRLTSITGEGFITDNLREDNIGGATTQIAMNNHEINRLISFYGRANYTFNNKYLFTATVRKDGSSRFGENNRWGLFPSAAFGWKIKEENFLKNVDAISDMKLRVSYGITGNQEINNFRYSQVYDVNSKQGTYFGDKFYPAYNVSGIANPDLKWEETAQFNIGADFGLFNNKLRGSLDYYKKTTSNLLLEIDAVQPAVSSTYLDNIGEMQNKGVELTLDAVAISNEDFKWNINLNLAYNQNKITKLYNNKDIIYGTVSGAGASGNTQILRVGESFGSFYGQNFVEMKNGKEVFESPASSITGKALPDMVYGFTNNFKYKNFDLSILIRAITGASVYNNTRAELAGGRLPGLNTTQEGADSYAAGGGGVVYQSSRWVENANFLRLDNMTLGYNFNIPSKVFKSIRAYVTGQNLFVLTNYSGYDPEVNNQQSSKGVRSVGIDYCSYPQSRTISGGLNINF
jgi:TonB-linked SusC/RagA family outer membrane protein